MMAWYDAALAAMRVPHQTRYVPTRYGQTHLLLAGDFCAGRVPVLLLHGININAAVWIPQIEGLWRDCAIIAPDMPGMAGKSAPLRLPYEDSSLADWLADVLDALGVARVVVVGGSAGGYYALKFAAYYPQRVVAALVFNPCGVSPYVGIYKLTRVGWVVRTMHWVSEHVLASRRFAHYMVQRGMSPALKPSAQNIELSYLLLRYYRRHPPPPLLTDSELAQISAPVELFSSEHELYTDPRAVMAKAAATLPNLYAAHWLAGAGHDVNKEQPALVNAAILRWVGASGNHTADHPQHQHAAHTPREGTYPVGEQ